MKILAINPWIYDFAAFDFWLKPYGFLSLLTYMKNQGVDINFIDCLEETISRDKFGRGKFPSEPINKPEIFSEFSRTYRRYGINPVQLDSALPPDNFDYILMTSSMTYWYTGLFDLIEIIQRKYPHTPVILGGTYVNLCYNHAKRHIKENTYICRNFEIEGFLKNMQLGYNHKELLSTLPDYKSFYSKLPYIPFRTSWGCPFNCSYCAIQNLSTGFMNIEKEKALDFIISYAQQGLRDFVFYDDALLYNQDYIKSFLKEIRAVHKDGLRFHTPNALHMRYLDDQICRLMKDTGFINPRFGVETLDSGLQKDFGNKIDTNQIEKAIGILRDSGFAKGGFSVYLLLGYPNQDFDRLRKEIDLLHKLGAKISLSEFSLTPKTRMFKEYKDRFAEPLLHNNSTYRFVKEKDLAVLHEIKDYTRRINQSF